MNSQTFLHRPRAREAGAIVGTLPPGPLNAITDVAGVRVGHTTAIEGDSIHTGITAILPHGGNIFQDSVPAAIHVGNGFGKLLGVTQVKELGELETPILLTGTLSVWKAADAMVAWLLAQTGMEDVRSINPVVGETNDGFLNDIRLRPIRPEHVTNALVSAAGGAVERGRCRCRDGGIWLERRHRHEFTQAPRNARRIHSRSTRTKQLRWRPDDQRCACRTRVRQTKGEGSEFRRWQHHDRRRD